MVKHRSVSQMGFAKCGEAYYLERVAKVPKKQAAWFAQGVAAHEALEYWERTYRSHSVEQAQAWYQESWDHQVQKMKEAEPDISQWMTGGRKKPENDLRDREVRGRDQVEEYITENLKSDLKVWEYAPGEPASEVDFEIELAGVKVVGKIDLIMEAIDNRLKLRDIKTGSKEPMGIIQFATYKIAVQETFGLTIDWADYWMCKDGGPSKPYDLRPYTKERVAEWYRRMDKAESEGLYLPNPGDHCRVCLVAKYCDSVQPYPAEMPKNFNG